MVTPKLDLKIDLSRLAWIKVVTPDKDYQHHWAYCPKAITDLVVDYGSQIIDSKNGLTIFPLGFRREERQEDLKSGDLIALTQHAKITHIVEILDPNFYEEGLWFHRYVKIVWWKREIDWNSLPHRSKPFGFDISIFDGNPHLFTNFKSFQERWENDGESSLKNFQKHLAEQLQQI